VANITTRPWNGEKSRQEEESRKVWGNDLRVKRRVSLKAFPREKLAYRNSEKGGPSGGGVTRISEDNNGREGGVSKGKKCRALGTHPKSYHHYKPGRKKGIWT